MSTRPQQSREARSGPGPDAHRGRGLPADGYVRLETVLAVIPVGRSTWWKGVREGRFPQPVKLGPRTTAWRVEDIRQLFSTW